jgi:hypothetical protein
MQARSRVWLLMNRQFIVMEKIILATKKMEKTTTKKSFSR